MSKNADFLLCQGDENANEEFLLEYQRCILLALKEEGILDQEQMEECVIRLEKQFQ